MAEDEKQEDAEPPAKKDSPVKTIAFSAITAVLLGGVAAGVAFVAPSGGQHCNASAPAKPISKHGHADDHDVAFVNIDPLVVSLGAEAASDYLKISITIETTTDNVKRIEHLMPRFRDVLNMYLRAVDEKVLTDPAAMARLRAQILRRMQLVAPADTVKGVLITDFVLT